MRLLHGYVGVRDCSLGHYSLFSPAETCRFFHSHHVLLSCRFMDHIFPTLPALQVADSNGVLTACQVACLPIVLPTQRYDDQTTGDTDLG